MHAQRIFGMQVSTQDTSLLPGNSEKGDFKDFPFFFMWSTEVRFRSWKSGLTGNVFLLFPFFPGPLLLPLVMTVLPDIRPN